MPHACYMVLFDYSLLCLLCWQCILLCVIVVQKTFSLVVFQLAFCRSHDHSPILLGNVSHGTSFQTYRGVDPVILRSWNNVSGPYTTTSSGSSTQNEWFYDNLPKYWYHEKHETYTARLRKSCWRFCEQKESLIFSRNCRKWGIIAVCFGGKAHMYKEGW
jgi:hypothetical protein